MSEFTLAIDPGLKCLGWALFQGKTLTVCGVSRSKNNLDLGACIKDHQDAMIDAPHRWMLQRAEAVIERPQIYPTAQQKGDQNDLVAIAMVACATVGGLCDSVRFAFPREWKGQMPKDVSHRLIDKRLSEAEKEVRDTLPKAKTILHNGLDAIGIGLWAVGRFR